MYIHVCTYFSAVTVPSVCTWIVDPVGHICIHRCINIINVLQNKLYLLPHRYVFLSPPVLPLTPENVTGVFEVVQNNVGLYMYLGMPEEYHHQPQTAARWYVNEAEDCSWKMIACCLDWVTETGVADYIIPYVEPPAGVHTVHEH